MRTHSDKYYEVVQSFNEKRERKLQELEVRENEIGAKHPDIDKLTKEIKGIPSKILFEVTKSGYKDLEALSRDIINEANGLRVKRAELAKSYGYPDDWFSLRYDCNICSDAGFVDGKMCICYKLALAKVRYNESGLEKLVEKQNFDNFNLLYYKGENRENMEKIYNKLVSYANSFSNDKMMNLLFIGKTGLGKTHLSTSIAKVVMDNGFDVVYETAQNIFTDIETDRYSRTDRLSDDMVSSKYYDCDLLIIDDLGTEVDNKYNLAGLYHLINSRIISEKSTIINTNLDIKQIYDRYEDRITSRLLGEYKAFEFKGEDIRFQKIGK